MLPQATLQAASPRTAAQLAVAGLGVAIVPSSAVHTLPTATVRLPDPAVKSDIIAITAAPHDALLRRFAADLKRRGLPDSGLAASGPCW